MPSELLIFSYPFLFDNYVSKFVIIYVFKSIFYKCYALNNTKVVIIIIKEKN